MNVSKNTPQRVLSQVYGHPWLITESGLALIGQVAERQGDLEAVMAKRGEKPENTCQMEIRDQVAILSVRGPIFRYANIFTAISGATSISALATDFRAAMDNPQVQAIILDVDSPGGHVSGVNEFAQQIFEARGQKKVVAYVGATSASAAYWLTSAAEEVVIDSTAMLGSIGVVVGYQKQEDGTMEIVSSRAPKKRLDPSSEAGRAEILARVDDIEAVFFAMAARNRGVSVETVEQKFGQGGMFVGEKAVAAGMADRLGSLEGLIEELNSKKNSPRPAWPMRSTAAVAAQQQGVPDMDLKELKAKYPEACQAIFDEGQAAGKEKGEAAAGKQAGEATAAEATRILGLAEVQFGAEQGAAFSTIVNTGVTVAQFKAIQAASPPAAAQGSTTQADMLAAIQGAGAPNPGAGGSQQGGSKDFATLVDEHRAANKSTKVAAMQAVQREHPAAHKAWLAKMQAN